MEVVHKVKQSHKCHKCSGVEFESDILLNSHIASNHGPPPKKQLYKCQVCSGVEFESEILLNSHIASVHTSKIRCKICDKL